MGTVAKRLTFDAALTALLIIEMFIQFTGVLAHEIIGAAFFVGVVVHLIIERKWLGAVLCKPRFARAHAAKTVIVVALAVIALALGASSLAISTILGSAGVSLLTFVPRSTWYTVHTVSAYALCAATVVHLVAHWTLVARAVKIPYDPARRAAIGTGIGVVAGGCAVALGVAGARAANVSGLLAAAGATGQTTAAAGSESAATFAAEVSDAGATDATTGGAGTGAPGNATGTVRMRANGTATDAAGTVRTRAIGTAEASSGASATSSSSTGSSAADGDSDSSAQATGTCPLCPKNCPLSAPRCNRPYEAGLIAA